MREDKEIKDDMEYQVRTTTYEGGSTNAPFRLILEVLLDIRNLLKK